MLAGSVAAGIRASAACARTTPSALSIHPATSLQVSVTVNDEGRPGYIVDARRRAGSITESRLGFLLTDAPKLERNFKAGDGVQTRSVDETWEQPWGERRYVRNRYNELRVPLVEKNPPQRALAVVFRVYDDGLGFRYEFPDQPQLHEVNIGDELTEFAVADPGTAWWIPGGEWNRYEYLYNRTPLSEVAQAHTPLTIRTDARSAHRVSRSRARRLLVDVVAPRRRHATESRAVARLARCEGQARPRRSIRPGARCRSPTTPAGSTSSDLILNLNEPNKLGDVSWFKPAKYVGIWWGMHLGTSTGRPGRSTAPRRRMRAATSTSRRRTAFAACWSKAGTKAGMATGSRMARRSASRSPIRISTWKGSPSTRKRKGVHLIGHHETSGQHRALRAAACRWPRSVPAARHRQREDRLCRRCRRRQGASARTAGFTSSGTMARSCRAIT